MEVTALILFIIHVLAVVAGGANAVLMPVIGPRLATASPEERKQLIGVAEAVSKIGKYAMATLLVTGLLVLWLRWDITALNVWFWIKMAGVAAMLVFIGLNDMNARKAHAGDAAAAAKSKQFGQLTGVAFLVVVTAAVFAFNS